MTDHWKYRVIEFECDGVRVRSIHETYYDANGVPNGYGERPAVVLWDCNGTRLTDELHKDAYQQIARITKALTLPVLSAADLESESRAAA